jgi:hypothetical protein
MHIFSGIKTFTTMRKFPGLVVIMLLTVSLLQFTACKKPDIKPPVDKDVCNITHTVYNFVGRDIDANFTYNPHGDPLAVDVTFPSTGNPNVIFLYDKHHRLTDYIGPYQKLDPANLPVQIASEFWYQYTYADDNPASLPVADTLHTFSIYNNGIFTEVVPKLVEKYTYDAQGRIVQVNSTTFNYDTRGNLIRPNVTYDDKKNFRSTNRIWQFISRDYSVNNNFVATSYNDKGLPTIIPKANTDFIRRIQLLSQIDYSCSTTTAQ